MISCKFERQTTRASVMGKSEKAPGATDFDRVVR